MNSIMNKEQFTTMSQTLKGTSKSKLPKRTDKTLVLAPTAPLLRLDTLKNLKRHLSDVTPPKSREAAGVSTVVGAISPTQSPKKATQNR